jgi:5-methyltetrahydrofolate--homocysteine methyltransferase
VRLDRAGRPFLVIGENIHASRVLKRTGRLAVELEGGTVGVAFDDAQGERRILPVHPDLVAGRDFAAGKIKHVASAIRWGLDDDRYADLAASYIRSLAARQQAAGADWLDLNADEVAPESGIRATAMAWLVGVIEPFATVPVAIDSSDQAVLATGVASSVRPSGRLLINSASLERPQVLDLAATTGCAVVLAASGPDGMPANAEERLANAGELVEAAGSRGIEPGAMYVDPLVLPVAVEPDAPSHVLEAARRLRLRYGEAIHLTGGLSNVSFGMPERRLLNDVFIDLAADAGIDSGIIDPVASDLGRVFAIDRSTEAYGLAADLLLGRDPFGAAYVAAFRAGRLAEGVPAG